MESLKLKDFLPHFVFFTEDKTIFKDIIADATVSVQEE
jgi:hypothetical protein